MGKKKKIGLSVWMLIALAAGIFVGFIMNSLGIKGATIKPFGDIFINLVKMLVVPLLMGSLITGTCAMNDMRKLGRVAVKAMLLYIITMMAAMVFGIIVAQIVKPGVGLSLTPTDATTYQGKQFGGILSTLVALFPSNIVASMATGDLLPLIIFSVFFGFCITVVGEKAKPLADGISLFTDVMIKMTQYVMYYAPIGSFALIAAAIADRGLALMLPLGKMIITVYCTLIAFVLLVYIPMLKFSAGIGLKQFLTAMEEPLLVAFSTTSSMATLPSNIRASQKLGLSEDVASFLIPLGNTVNMAGAAMYIAIVANFVAQVYGMTLTLGQQFNVVFTALLISIGAVGIPGYMIVMMTSTFSAVGIPLDGVALVAGVDKILDMARTPCNIIGDVAIAMVIDKKEKEKAENTGKAEKGKKA